MASVEDSWVVVDKTASGTLRAKASNESLCGSDSDSDSGEGGCGGGARVHVRADRADAASLAPELLNWLNNSASESSTGLPLVGQRNSTASKSSSFRTNSSSAAARGASPRSSIGGDTDDIVAEDAQGTFVVKVVEVRQVGATRPMSLQCAAQVGDERFVIPHVMTRPRDYNTWSARMDDTFVFDVARQFTFNLAVYAAAVAPQPQLHRALLPHRLSMAARRHVGRSSVACDSAPSLASAASSAKTTGKIRAGIRRIFGTRPGDVSAAATADDSDQVITTEATDDHGRRVAVLQHTEPAAVPEPQPQPLKDARLARLSLLPRTRTSTVASAAAAFAGRGRAASSASAATTATTATFMGGGLAGAAAPVGELFLDLRVARREKRRATFLLPAVNQEQEALRGGAHVEMAVVLEFGVLVRETSAERQRREQRAEAAAAARARAQAEQTWDAADESDRKPRLRSALSVFTRSGRLSTWRRYWAELSASDVLFFDSEACNGAPVASVPLLHLAGAGVPSSDLVSIGPGGIELRLSPMAMTDRHRRTSAFPRVDRDRTLTAAAMAHGDDDAAAFGDWQCRVYLLLDTMADRDRWLAELNKVAVPSAERARLRMQQRIAATKEEEATLCQLGKALEKMSVAQTAYAKRVFVDGGHRVVSMSSARPPIDFDATLTEMSEPVPRKPVVAMAFGKPATFSLTVSPDLATLSSSHQSPQPAKKRLRARRRSNSVADMYSKQQQQQQQQVEDSKPMLRRKGSGASTVLEVVGKTMERRPGTVSRRFLFVWNINDI
ncbi:hypothetical protein GGF42_004104 [Coemansia sp. RSA 2424]|nr:hypothetical protein GGF42_004104 [Coemansia sp. RSA 2424]